MLGPSRHAHPAVGLPVGAGPNAGTSAVPPQPPGTCAPRGFGGSKLLHLGRSRCNTGLHKNDGLVGGRDFEERKMWVRPILGNAGHSLCRPRPRVLWILIFHANLRSLLYDPSNTGTTKVTRLNPFRPADQHGGRKINAWR